MEVNPEEKTSQDNAVFIVLGKPSTQTVMGQLRVERDVPFPHIPEWNRRKVDRFDRQCRYNTYQSEQSEYDPYMPQGILPHSDSLLKTKVGTLRIISMITAQKAGV